MMILIVFSIVSQKKKINHMCTCRHCSSYACVHVDIAQIMIYDKKENLEFHLNHLYSPSII